MECSLLGRKVHSIPEKDPRRPLRGRFASGQAGFGDDVVILLARQRMHGRLRRQVAQELLGPHGLGEQPALGKLHASRRWPALWSPYLSCFGTGKRQLIVSFQQRGYDACIASAAPPPPDTP